MEQEVFGEPVQEEEVKAKNFFARLGGVFSSPREAFTEIGRAPRLAIPIIALVFISALSVWYLAQKIDTRAATQAQMEQMVARGFITEEQMNQQLARSADGVSPLMLVPTAVFAIINCLVLAGYGKLFGMMAGAKNSYKNLLGVSVYAMLAVGIVSIVLTIIILQVKGASGVVNPNSIVASSLGAWIENAAGTDALPKFIMGLAKAVDIFRIWTIALLSIGFSAVSKKLKTSTAAVWLGGIYAIFSIIGAAISSVFGA